MILPIPRLAHGSPGQDTPGRLVPGLRRLEQSREFLIEQEPHLRHELELKKRREKLAELKIAFLKRTLMSPSAKHSAFDNPSRRAAVLVAEPSLACRAAQAECLELFLDFLPQHYPQHYTASRERQTVTVCGEEHHIGDFLDCPLELCARIVQEDLILMRRSDVRDPGLLNSEFLAPDARQEEGHMSYVMSAAAVVFSFGLQNKLSQPLSFLHAPVPRFEPELLALVTRTFDSIRPGKQLWRNNWGLSNTGDLVLVADGLRDSANSPIAGEERVIRLEAATMMTFPLRVSCSEVVTYRV